MIKKLIFSIFFMHAIALLVRADDGMWIPLLLKGHTIDEMHKKGFKLSAEDIYSVNQASMKDAVLIFGGGCTGEMISAEGLLITNHHCGYGQIQWHSSVENDLITNGFWAKSRSEELSNPGLSVRFLVRMEDVTQAVTKGCTPQMSMEMRNSIVKQNASMLAARATSGTNYKARVVPFFNGNDYYLFVEDVFEDVRLVGAPPAAIGKFGGDTDNWVWPRHTGDFSIFRIYANKNNQSAPYSPDNIPYKPKKHFPISLKGVKPNDFTMVYGYPARTQQYLTSDAVQIMAELSDPNKIEIREKRLEIISQAMVKSPVIRIQYAAIHAGIANAWKKWIGESSGLKRLNAVSKKREQEAEFQVWVNADTSRKQLYGSLLKDFSDTYYELKPYWLANDFYQEAGYRDDLFDFVSEFSGKSAASSKADKESLLAMADELYKDMDTEIERRTFEAFLVFWFQKVDTAFWHPELRNVYAMSEKKRLKYVNEMFQKSVFSSKQNFNSLRALDASSFEKILKDPLFIFVNSLNVSYKSKIRPQLIASNLKLDSLYMVYIDAQRQMLPERQFFADANSTLRVAYGAVERAPQADGILYDFRTTLDGVVAKDNPSIYDYNVPQRLKDLYRTKDYGRWAENGTVPVCFLASNHTTGGNSGSPVIDADGNLIGVNFDRSWESTMSDVMFDPVHCRNIVLDIRYALFVIDKFAGAGYLIDEMTLVK